MMRARVGTGSATRRALAALLVLGALAPLGARAQTPPAADERAPTAAAPPDLPDLSRDAEEVSARLRQMRESLADTSAFDALEAEIQALSQRITETWNNTTEVLKAKPRRLPLDSLASSWSALRESLVQAATHVNARAKRRDADLESLAQMREAWTKALDVAQKGNAPSSVVERVRATIASIDAVKPLVEQRRARLLVLEDGVSRSMQACDDALGRIHDARREAVERIFSAHEPPLWKAGNLSGEARTEVSRARLLLGTGLDILSVYFSEYRAGVALSGLLVLVLIGVMRRARSEAASVAERDAFFASAALVFETPISAAFLLGFVISRPLRPHPPVMLLQLNLAIGMVAAVVLLRRFLGPGLRRAAYGLTALFLLDLTSQTLATISPALEQVVSLVEKGATAALLVGVAALLRDPAIVPSWSPRSRATTRIALYLFALACLTAAGAAMFGYVDFADFLGGGALYLVYAAFVLLAFRLAANGLVAIALVKQPLARLHALARHRTLVERRIESLLDLLVVGLWVWTALYRFELLGWASEAVDRTLGARLHVGDLDLAIGRLLGFAAVLVAAYLVTRVVVFLLEEDVYSRMELPRGVPYALSTLTRYALLLAGFLVALGTLGLDLTKVTVLVSAFGIGIGFGLQQIISNFVSGLILLFERPVQVGDSVQLGDLGGQVTRIGIRSSTVLTPEGAEVIVPNSKMIEDRVTNWTLSDRRRRVDLEVGVEFDADSERILGLLVEVARRDPRVSADREPEALLAKFGEKSAEFHLRVWTSEPNWMRLRSDLGVAVQRALRALREESAGAAGEGGSIQA
ncbi:MAG TPA: mechanosensitive ion channel domain-containing protein [Myxococcota bacterium]|nr:mechanosensitive ion channel domain-containing protein [Myxococcota bacterium]